MDTYDHRPVFESGKILRNVALKAMNRQCFDFPRLLFLSYGNGILTGCQLSTTKDTITMGCGVICFEGNLYSIYEPLSVAYMPTDTTCILKLYVGSEEDDNACRVRRLSLKLTEKEQLGSGEIELCRFRLQQGAYLRSEYVDFRDRNTLYDTLNTINSTYAAKGGTGLSPDITQAYARSALTLPELSESETVLCLNWLKEPYALPREVLQAYLFRFGQLEPGEQPGNQGLYDGLQARLQQLESGQPSGSFAKRRAPRKIMVD